MLNRSKNEALLLIMDRNKKVLASSQVENNQNNNGTMYNKLRRVNVNKNKIVERSTSTAVKRKNEDDFKENDSNEQNFCNPKKQKINNDQTTIIQTNKDYLKLFKKLGSTFDFLEKKLTDEEFHRRGIHKKRIADKIRVFNIKSKIILLRIINQVIFEHSNTFIYFLTFMFFIFS